MVEPSRRAIDAGKKAFPAIEFRKSSIIKTDERCFPGSRVYSSTIRGAMSVTPMTSKELPQSFERT